MSLDEVSRLSGVSKSMLGQIERGEVNPTISTVWKIACGLNVPYSELLSRPQVEREALNIADIRPVLEDEGRYRNYLLFPQEVGRRFEVLYIEIDAGGALEAGGASARHAGVYHRLFRRAARCAWTAWNSLRQRAARCALQPIALTAMKRGYRPVPPEHGYPLSGLNAP